MAFHSRTSQQSSKVHVKTHELCYTDLQCTICFVEVYWNASIMQMLYFICRFSSLHLMRFVHFQAVWLDFCFIVAKIRKFLFTHEKKQYFI